MSTHDEEHHHPHDHHHYNHADEGMAFTDKLAKLFDHWVSHNESHGESYVDWRQKAEQEGLNEIADLLSEIDDLNRRITEKLKQAQQILKNR